MNVLPTRHVDARREQDVLLEVTAGAFSSSSPPACEKMVANSTHADRSQCAKVEVRNALRRYCPGTAARSCLAPSMARTFPRKRADCPKEHKTGRTAIFANPCTRSFRNVRTDRPLYGEGDSDSAQATIVIQDLSRRCEMARTCLLRDPEKSVARTVLRF